MAETLAREISTPDVVTPVDVKTLASAEGPCITLVMPVPNPLELVARLKNALRSVERQLARHIDTEVAPGIVAPIEQLATQAETAQMWADALIVFRSPGVFQHYWMRERLREVAVVGERFQIRPLLGVLAREQRFHLLALSRHEVRLFRCAPHRAEEVRLEGQALRNMRDWPHNREADHLLENRMPAGPSAGSMQGVAFGTGAEGEKEEERLRHFLKEVEKGVTAILRQDGEPLIVAGVEYEVAVYRRLNTYPLLLEQSLHGSPDGLTAQVLHERAWEIVNQCPSQPLKKALAEYEKHGGTSRVSGEPGVVAEAALEGRVASLFIAESAGSDQPDDPLNIAAIETVLHGGSAFELKPAEMSLKGPVAALLRF